MSAGHIAITATLSAAVLGLTAPRDAEASLYLAYAGTTAPVVDTDGVVPMADIDTTPFTTLLFDVLTDTTFDPSGAVFSGGPGWSFSFGNLDPAEILPGTFSFAFAGVLNPALIPIAIVPGAPSTGKVPPLGISVSFDIAPPHGVLPSGTLIGTLSFVTAVPGLRPDDDFPDLLFDAISMLTGTATPTLIDFAPGPMPAGVVPFDLQQVPLPISAVLLPGALLALTGLRRRHG